MWQTTIIVIIIVITNNNLLFITSQTQSDTCTTPNNETAKCISLYACPVLLESLVKQTKERTNFVEKSHCGNWSSAKVPMVCCGSTSTFNVIQTTTTEPPKKQLAKRPLSNKRFCGFQHTDDYFYKGNDTAIDEFPWLAVFKYGRDPDLDDDLGDNFVEFGCSGALINNRYVLTAAQCLRLRTSSIVAVRLGEYNIKHEVDCVRISDMDDCNNPIEDVKIEKKIRHQKYDRRKGLNDIALLRLDRTIEYSDYIRPICLPIPGTRLSEVNDTVLLSGFGRLDEESDYAIIKKRISSRIISNEECENKFSIFPNKHRNVNKDIMCSIELDNTTSYLCEGDSGGPLMFSNHNQWHIEGISVWSINICGGVFPFAHVRVVNYLDWIEENIEPW